VERYPSVAVCQADGFREQLYPSCLSIKKSAAISDGNALILSRRTRL
jgi:hypothetical protein